MSAQVGGRDVGLDLFDVLDNRYDCLGNAGDVVSEA